MPETIVLVTGGFDPLHSGHIAYLNAAKKLGDILVVGLNSDDWLCRKKGHPFMPINERVCIIENLKMVDKVLLFDDNDNSARRAILNVRLIYPENKIIFANGGDRTKTNIPEMDVEDDNLEFVFGIGGTDKKNSSSWILSKALETQKPRKTNTRWGSYTVLLDEKTCKVKELIVNPGGCLSYQAHQKRSEIWFVKSGIGKVIRNNSEKSTIDHLYIPEKDEIQRLKTNHLLVISCGEWHQLINDSKTETFNLIEIQYGKECVEGDILHKEIDK